MARLVDPRDEAPIDPTPVRAGDAIDCGVLGVLMMRWVVRSVYSCECS